MKMSLKQWREELVRRNAAFEKLTPAQKRVVIAKDVIARLNAKTFIAGNGYLHRKDQKHLVKETMSRETQFAEVVRDVTCTGCALAGMMVCLVDRADKLKIRDLPSARFDGSVINAVIDGDYMSKYFPARQLANIESAFERREMCGGNLTTSHVIGSLASIHFSSEDDPDKRMRKIMKNIIRNKGNFHPSGARYGKNRHRGE